MKGGDIIVLPFFFIYLLQSKNRYQTIFLVTPYKLKQGVAFGIAISASELLVSILAITTI